MAKQRAKLTPAKGAALFSSQAGMLTIAAFSLVYTIILLIMQGEISASHGETGTIGSMSRIAAVLLPSGLFISYILPKFVPVFSRPLPGLVIAAGGLAIYALSSFAGVLSEESFFWVIEGAAEGLALGMLCWLFIALILAEMGARVVSQIGTVAAVVCAGALILLAVRMIVVFSSVASMAGSSMDFTKVTDCSGLAWALRGAQAGAPNAAKAFYGRVFERGALAVFLLCGSVFSLNFARFFDKFNRQMVFAAQLPREPADEPVISRKKPPVDDQNVLPAKGTNSMIRMAASPYTAPRKAPPAPEPEPEEEEDFSDDTASAAAQAPAPQRTQARVVKVSARPVPRSAPPPQRQLPPMDDESIWDHYS